MFKVEFEHWDREGRLRYVIANGLSHVAEPDETIHIDIPGGWTLTARRKSEKVERASGT
jgi:hypothetical protein